MGKNKKDIAVSYIQLGIFCLAALVLYFLLGWGFNKNAQADTISEGKKIGSCTDLSQTIQNHVEELYNGGIVCTGTLETGCQCTNQGQVIYWVDKNGNEWLKGNDDIGGSRVRILGYDGSGMTWIMNGPKEGEKFYNGDYNLAGDYVIGWDANSKDNDLHVYDNLVMLNKPHLENWSSQGLIINMFSKKPVQIGGMGNGRLNVNGNMVVDENVEYDNPLSGYAYINSNNIYYNNDVLFPTGDSYFGGMINIATEGDVTSTDKKEIGANGILFYPWQYYKEDPRTTTSKTPGIYDFDKYKNTWRKRWTPIFTDQYSSQGFPDWITDYQDTNGFAALMEVSDFLADCDRDLDRSWNETKVDRDCMDSALQSMGNVEGDDRVDLRLYLAAGTPEKNRFAIYSYKTPNLLNPGTFYDNSFKTPDWTQVQHAFYGDGSVYHGGMMDLNLQTLSREYIDQNNLRNATSGNALLTIWGNIDSSPPQPVVMHEFDDTGMAFHRSGVLFNPLSVAPGNAKEGMVYYSIVNHELRYYDGSFWHSLGNNGGGSAGSGIGTYCQYIGANFKQMATCPSGYMVTASCVRDATYDGAAKYCCAPDGTICADHLIKCCPLINN